MQKIDDVRIREMKELVAPSDLILKSPACQQVNQLVYDTRAAIQRILQGRDNRLLVIVGHTIHDPLFACEYARWLIDERKRLSNQIEVIMCFSFARPDCRSEEEKFVNADINEELGSARKLLLDIISLGIPAGAEFLDTITPQYFADLASWAAMGAGTIESQVHRELASGLSCPIGFKTRLGGNLTVAFDALKAASHPHHFLGVTKSGHSAIVTTTGNEHCHIVMPLDPVLPPHHYDIEKVALQAASAGLPCRLVIDAAHNDSRNDRDEQPLIVRSVAEQIKLGERRIIGVMMRSYFANGGEDWIIDSELFTTLARSVSSTR